MPVQCPNCGGPHPKWECKKLLAPAPEAPKPPLGPVAKIEALPNQPLTPSTDYKGYMREYMRKKRAKAKAIKEGRADGM